MIKIFTLCVSKEFIKDTRKVLKSHKPMILDIQESKWFDLQGQRVKNITMVCPEDIFNLIVESLDATRVF